MEDLRWDNPAHMPLSNGPIRTVTGPGQLTHALDSDRREMEYLLAFPFHAVDPNPWPPLQFTSNGVPVTIRRPLGAIAMHSTEAQMGNEEADAYCTIVRLSTPASYHLSSDEGWKIVKRLLEWIRVKCRHYWLLHGINGFGATYRGTLLTREGMSISQQNIAMYGPNVIVNPLTAEIWASLLPEMQTNTELPLSDSLFCDALLSIVAGDTTKALLEAGVAMEVALTQLLVDVALTSPPSPAKANFIKNEGDRQPFGKKLNEWTTTLALEDVKVFSFKGIPPNWHVTVRELYKLRNGVAHGGRSASSSIDAVKSMFAAGTLLEYCRSQRLRLGLNVFSMPTNSSPWQQIRFCHDGHMSVTSNIVAGTLPTK